MLPLNIEYALKTIHYLSVNYQSAQSITSATGFFSLWVQSCSVAFTMGILEQSICNGTELLTIQKKMNEFRNSSIFFFLRGDEPV